MEIIPLSALETPLSELEKFVPWLAIAELSAFERLRLLDAIVLLRALLTPLNVTSVLLTALEKLAPCAARLDASALETPDV